MRVYLVRHGEAKSKQEDPARGLTDFGARDVSRVAALLKPLGLHVRTIWHSGKARAEQTAEILYGAVTSAEGVRQREGLSPNDPVAPMCDELNAATDNVMLVGHMPFMGKLASLLVTGDARGDVVAYPAGALVCLERTPDGAWLIRTAIDPEFCGA